jgi:hypothetical protein
MVVDRQSGTRGLLGLPVTLFDLAKDGESIASTLPRIRCSQCVFAVPTLVDAVIVRKGPQDGPKFIIANCQDADINYWLTHRRTLTFLAVRSMSLHRYPARALCNPQPPGRAVTQVWIDAVRASAFALSIRCCRLRIVSRLCFGCPNWIVLGSR